MAGIVSGISNLAVGPCDARRRQRQTQTQTQAQSNPNPTNTPTPAPSPSPSPSTPPTPSEEKHVNAYCNAGKQNIKGLTNQTGYVKGNANGVINFGDLTASAGAQRQA